MNIHILAISGSMTTPLALELTRQGHIVTGSDQEKIYPPFSTQLQKANIAINSIEINKNIDLVIVGGGYKAFDKTRQELEQVKQLQIPYLPATQYIADNVVKKDSIIIAGSLGKSTVSALVTWILIKAGLNPSYFVASQFVDDIPSCKITRSEWSVVEGGEDINGLETKAKFLYYPTKYVILTASDWEHRDSYPTESANFNAFKQLVQNIPKDGLLVYNPNNKNNLKLLPFCQASTIPYNSKLNFSTSLIGQYNRENIIAAYTLCQALHLPENTVQSAIASFKGIFRRLETIANTNGILFIDDFAQSAARVKSALTAIAETYPHRPIKVYFEPHASFLQYRSGLVGFKQAFAPASEVILSKIKYSPNIDKKDRVTANEFALEVGNKLKYIPLDTYIFNYYSDTLRSGDILVHFSSGGLTGIENFKKIICHNT